MTQDAIEKLYDMPMVGCPECGREWIEISDQAAAIKLVGHCIVCLAIKEYGTVNTNVVELTQRLDELGIIVERRNREKEAGMEVKPCPICLHRTNKFCTLCGGVGSIGIREVGNAEEA